MADKLPLFAEWNNFKISKWCDEINVRDFIQSNYEPYEGDSSFLTSASESTTSLWNKILNLIKEEQNNGGVLNFDPRISKIDAYKSGYIDKELEQIVGLQTESPLTRAFMPYGGIRMADSAAISHGFKTNPETDVFFAKYHKTHNQGVFDAYTEEITRARHTHIITGLPDAYARGRIIGDYRRVALYGIDYLINEKIVARNNATLDVLNAKNIRMREETMEQIKSLKAMLNMAKSYGFDISRPAKNAKEAIQWVYFGYLAAIKDQNGAAMSIGRVATFLDIYIQRDLKNNVLTESEAQELMDHFIMKLRIVRFIRTKEYDQIFSGDPIWATEAVGGMNKNNATLVTKNSFRVLQSLINMGAAPEPNITILWSKNLPINFKKFCALISIKCSSIQYESDDLIRENHGDDYAIACCVSPMKIGKEMQFFGARANLPKALLYALNNGIDEMEPEYGKMGPDLGILKEGVLNFDVVYDRYLQMLDWLARVYVNALNVIHYMHDKYYYEAAEMALHDIDIKRFFATGIAGLSVVADSLSAIKFAKVTPKWKTLENNTKIIESFSIEGEFPKFGNDDDRVDELAANIVKDFYNLLKKYKTYRHSKLTMSILTITSNVVYGSVTGDTPDGRKAKTPFAPGANPMNGRDETGAINSLKSVAKLPYKYARDGISNTWSIIPNALGNDEEKQVNNLVDLIDGYFQSGGYHLNVNVLTKETLIDAQKNPDKYPQLTVRVSGYAVNFNKLSKLQQDDIISRTFHTKID